MQRFVVPCECGIGAKLFLRAGEHAQNPGRFYYRCPSKSKSCSFVWADEILSNKYAHLHPLMLPCQESFPHPHSHGNRSRVRSIHQSSVGMSPDGLSSEHVVTGIPHGQHVDNPTNFVNILCCCYGISCTLLCFMLVFVVIALLMK